jgi:hypothetical protein
VREVQVIQPGLIQSLALLLLTEAAKAALLLEQVQTVVLVAGVERLPQAVQEIHQPHPLRAAMAHQPHPVKVIMAVLVLAHLGFLVVAGVVLEPQDRLLLRQVVVTAAMELHQQFLAPQQLILVEAAGVVFHRQANLGVQAVQVGVQTALERELLQLRQRLILVAVVAVLDKLRVHLLLVLQAVQAVQASSS